MEKKNSNQKNKKKNWIQKLNKIKFWRTKLKNINKSTKR